MGVSSALVALFSADRSMLLEMRAGLVGLSGQNGLKLVDGLMVVDGQNTPDV